MTTVVEERRVMKWTSFRREETLVGRDDDLTGILYYAYDYGCWFSYDSLNLAIDMCELCTISLIRATFSSCAKQSP
jgi:hypothetical protein